MIMEKNTESNKGNGEDEKEIYGNELHNILFRAFGQHAAEMSDDEKSKFIKEIESRK